MQSKSAKSIAGEQLSLFALPPTANIKNAPAAAILVDLFEISEPSKYMMTQRKAKP